MGLFFGLLMFSIPGLLLMIVAPTVIPGLMIGFFDGFLSFMNYALDTKDYRTNREKKNKANGDAKRALKQAEWDRQGEENIRMLIKQGCAQDKKEKELEQEADRAIYFQEQEEQIKNEIYQHQENNEMQNLTQAVEKRNYSITPRSAVAVPCLHCHKMLSKSASITKGMGDVCEANHEFDNANTFIKIIDNLKVEEFEKASAPGLFAEQRYNCYLKVAKEAFSLFTTYQKLTFLKVAGHAINKMTSDLDILALLKIDATEAGKIEQITNYLQDTKETSKMLNFEFKRNK